LAGPKLVSKYPEVLEALSSLEGAISAGQMRQMNLAVDLDHELPAQVARHFEGGSPPPLPSSSAP
jgi:glycine betaine/choline ABC-type transport system substrate-binding protein